MEQAEVETKYCCSVVLGAIVVMDWIYDRLYVTKWARAETKEQVLLLVQVVVFCPFVSRRMRNGGMKLVSVAHTWTPFSKSTKSECNDSKLSMRSEPAEVETKLQKLLLYPLLMSLLKVDLLSFVVLVLVEWQRPTEMKFFRRRTAFLRSTIRMQRQTSY
jgi:hypothetical protein